MSDTIIDPADAAPRWACPDATLVLRADAPKEQWLRARTEGIGGSDVSAITGISKYATPYSVWLDKIGESSEVEQNHAMRMGNLLEPIVVQLFQEDYGISTRRAGLMRSRQHPFMQVTVDRLTADGGILECKTSTGWLSSEWEDGQVPDHAELQVQHGLAVTGRSHAWVAGLLDGRDFFVRRVDRDDALIAQLIEIERKFWEEHVLARQDPPVTAVDLPQLRSQFSDAESVSVSAELSELTVLRAEYEEARDAEKAAVKAKDDAAAKIRKLAGHADTIVDHENRAWFTVKQNGAFSASRFVKDHPDIAEDFMVPAERLDASKLAENHPELHASYRARVLRLPKLKLD